MAADPRHPQVPCLGGQAFLLHHARGNTGTGLFMHVGSPSEQTLQLRLLPREKNLGCLLISFLPVAAAPRSKIPCCPHTRVPQCPTGQLPQSWWALNTSVAPAVCTDPHTPEHRAFLLLLSILACTHQPYWGGAGETQVTVKTP